MRGATPPALLKRAKCARARQVRQDFLICYVPVDDQVHYCAPGGGEGGVTGTGPEAPATGNACSLYRCHYEQVFHTTSIRPCHNTSRYTSTSTPGISSWRPGPPGILTFKKDLAAWRLEVWSAATRSPRQRPRHSWLCSHSRRRLSLRAPRCPPRGRAPPP